MNEGTFIAVAILSLIVLGAVVSIIRQVRKGRSVSCGADCAHCAMDCHRPETAAGAEDGAADRNQK